MKQPEPTTSLQATSSRAYSQPGLANMHMDAVMPREHARMRNASNPPSMSRALTLLTGCGPPGATATCPERLHFASLKPMSAAAANTAAPTTTGATMAAMLVPPGLLPGPAGGVVGAGADGVTGRSG